MNLRSSRLSSALLRVAGLPLPGVTGDGMGAARVSVRWPTWTLSMWACVGKRARGLGRAELDQQIASGPSVGNLQALLIT